MLKLDGTSFENQAALGRRVGSGMLLEKNARVLADCTSPKQAGGAAGLSLAGGPVDGLEAFFSATQRQLRNLYSQPLEPRQLLCALLHAFGLSDVDETLLDALVNSVGYDNSGSISFEEFEACAIELKIGALQALGGPGGGTLSVCHWNSRGAYEFCPAIEDLTEWLHTVQPVWTDYRWIELQGSHEKAEETAQALKLIAAKFSLHPLALEDALEACLGKGGSRRPKVQFYESCTFIAFPCACVVHSQADRDHLSPRLSGSADDPFEIQISMVSIFLLTPGLDTLIAVGSCSDAFARVHHFMSKSYSLLRQGNCRLLLHRLLDSMVDQLAPVSAAMEQLASETHHGLRGCSGGSGGSRCERSFFHDQRARRVRNIDLLQRESSRMLSTVLPVTRVVSGLRQQIGRSPRAAAASPTETGVPSGAEEDEEASALFRDLEDRLEAESFRLNALVKASERLGSEHQRSIDLETNKILTALTLISAVFVPGEFMAGVWGMNFDDMPELHWKYGYVTFWVITLLFVGGFFVYVRRFLPHLD